MRYMNIKLYFYLFPFLLPTVCRFALPHAARSLPPQLLPSAAVGLCPFERSRRVSPCRFAHIKQNLLENISFSFSLSRSRFYSHFLSLSLSPSSPATHNTPQLVLTVTPTQAAGAASLSLYRALCLPLSFLVRSFIFYFAFCMLIRNCCCNCFHCYARSAARGGSGAK